MEFRDGPVKVTINFNREQNGEVQCLCGDIINIKDIALNDSDVQELLNGVRETLQKIEARREAVRKIKNGELSIVEAIRTELQTRLDECPFTGGNAIIPIQCRVCGGHLGVATVQVGIPSGIIHSFPRLRSRDFLKLEVDNKLRGYLANRHRFRDLSEFEQWKTEKPNEFVKEAYEYVQTRPEQVAKVLLHG